MLNIIVTRPHHFDGRARHGLGNQRRLNREVRLGLAAKSTAQQQHIHRDLLNLQAKSCSHQLSGSFRCLHRSPDFTMAFVDRQQRSSRRRLHGGMGQMRHVVISLDQSLVTGFFDSRIQIAVAAQNLARTVG